jgi:hypothetical protein
MNPLILYAAGPHTKPENKRVSRIDQKGRLRAASAERVHGIPQTRGQKAHAANNACIE